MKMLIGEPVPFIGGRGSTLQAQVAALGWKIDDLLVTSVQGDGSLRQLALSCKGNVQVTGTSLPASFVSAAWAQWHHPDNPLSQSTNHLALVTAARRADFDATWREVKMACAGVDADLGLARIRENAKQSQLFETVATKAPGEHASDQDTRQLIQRLEVLPIELHAADALRENEAIGQCRQLLASGDLQEAEALWKRLLNLAKDARLEHGTLQLLNVWEQLRVSFDLRDHTDYRSDWEILSRYSADQSASIVNALPNGHRLARATETTQLVEGLRADVISIVIGESGSGKSALVKTVIDANWPTATQLWLGPEAAATVLSSVRRQPAGLRHGLRDLLRGTRARANVLVLDAAEQLDAAALATLAQALSSESVGNVAHRLTGWRVVITTQPRGLSQLAAALAKHATHLVEVGPVSTAEVREAVAASPTLRWLTSHEATLSALTSLKALAWVLGAGVSLATAATPLTSHIQVVEALWQFWTQQDLAAQALLMHLGMRDAESEHSFALSSLNADQLKAIQAGQDTLPLRVDLTTNRVRFEHDLAADWARFQRLKELSTDPQAWAALAAHPMWANALRLLGQQLLRRPVGNGTAWDEAFAIDSPRAGVVQGILFDALCLDPEALRFLIERADWLLAGHGQRFDQLLTRFLHIATLPPQTIQASSGWFEFYAETHRRAVVIARWVPMLQFVLAQQDKLAERMSAPLARFTHSWLTQTPKNLGDNSPNPFRGELVDLAVAVVRSIQVRSGAGDILGDVESEFYAAVLAGTPDRPAEIAALVRELSGRTPIDAQTQSRIQTILAERHVQHQRRLAADPMLRARHEAARQASRIGDLGREKLPPWPIGASLRVNWDFRKSCFKGDVLEPLMRVAPATAAEVLLALIVDDKPERDFDAGRQPFRERLGLDYPVDAFPSIFWKSPFWPFLQIAPDHALAALLQLVAFCTERWAEGSRHYGLELPMDGAVSSFTGGPDVFAWSQGSSAQTGHLHCALDSLERWLVTQINEGIDVSARVRQLLAESRSAAIVGVLVNVGKHQPLLFSGPLSPLLSRPELYAWDSHRVEYVEHNFAGGFVSAGEQLFELAKQWVLAPHRRIELMDVANELILADPALAEAVRGWTRAWVVPDDLKSGLEQRYIAARLDAANYSRDEQGQRVFVLPQPLAQELQAWEQTHAPARMQLTLPSQCRRLLDAGEPLNDAQAARLFELLAVPPHEESWVQECFERAIAATLTVLASDWLARNAPHQQKVDSVFVSALASLPNSTETLGKARFPTTHTGMDFVAWAVTRQWAVEPGAKSDRRVVRLLTSGDRSALQTTISMAYRYRADLGDCWWRLLQIGVLWSGLSMLGPRYGDSDANTRVWTHWWRRLRNATLRQPGTPDALDLGRINAGCERLMRHRQLRAHLADASRRHPDQLAGAGLDTEKLGDLFSWLLRGAGTGEQVLDASLTGRLWALEVERARTRADDDGEMHLTGQFAYHVVERLSALTLLESPTATPPLWHQVLALGPAGHNAVQHFIRTLFLRLSKGGDPQRFEAIWQAMADYALAADWNLPGLWFHGEHMRRAILGFGREWALDRLPAGAALRMRGRFALWGKDHLKREDNLAGLCFFVASGFGAPLRFDALVWINAALQAPHASIGFHRDRCGDALVELIVTILQEDLVALRQRADARAALLDIAAALAASGRADALAIQDRLRVALAV